MRPRRVLAGLLTLLLTLCLLSGCRGGMSELRLPEPPAHGCVLDVAGVLGDATETHIQTRNNTLGQADAKIYVAALDVLGGREAADYAAGLVESWNLGERDLLLLLSVSEGEYYLLQGGEVGADLTDDMLADYAWNYLEHDFAAGDYDAGVRKVFDALCQWYETRYELTPAADETQDSDDSAQSQGGGVSVWLVVLLAAVVAAVVLVVVKLRRGDSRRQGASRRRYQGSRRRR